MQGYTTNYVNLIADNLRDRYDNGFPILKELIQNADDAKAGRLIFGRHPGFPDSRHPLLQGPGLWCFNDGEFKPSDANALRSFGIGSKAGDTGAIGKFGLGMKSVFHLCEALFYVAWDGERFDCEGLTPWKQDGQSLHRDWDETCDADWNRLKDLGRDLAADGGRDGAWFLLWLPLRMKRHLRTPEGHETGAVIRRFPGDRPADGLAFLNEGKLTHEIAAMLPLLRHLKRVEHKGGDNRFVLELADGPRLMGEAKASGQVLWVDGKPRFAFSGRRVESPDADGRFADMKARKEWPRTRYRDELGKEREEKDKASPEGAVLFCSGHRNETISRLHWAVFLPVEDDSEDLGGIDGKRGHSLILHGQFFLDAGRKRIHDHEHLHQEPESFGDAPIDESRLRGAWNQRLAQEVVLPLVLPTLDDHVRQHGLSDGECHELTGAISKSDWFKTFRKHTCQDGVWLRTLEQNTGPRWCLVEGDSRSELRPLPKPPGSAPERPWRVFPELAACGVVPYDVEAPCLNLSDRPGKWSEPELERLLSRLDGLFLDAPSMGYVIDFLDTCAGSYLSTERVQSRFLAVLRHGLEAAGREARRGVAAKATRLVGFLQPEKRLALTADLPESILKDLWGIDAPVLLVPRGLEPESSGKASPDETALVAWLRVLDRALDSPDNDGPHQPILQTVQGLLHTLTIENRALFLRKHRTLRVIGARDARSRVEKPVSVEDLDRVRAAGCLFTFAEGFRGAEMGFAPLLARAMPDADVCLVHARTYRDLLSEDEAQGGSLLAASNAPACLAAVGRYTGRLGDIADRRSLLEKANDTGADPDARRGFRFLLHGARDHRDDDDAKLWVGRHDQHPVWNRLWGVMHEDAQWSLVDRELANTIPGSRWRNADIAEVDARTLIEELRSTGRGIDAPEEFSVDERDEILSRIEDEDLWLRLPLHTTLEGTPVSAVHERVYLAPRTEGHEDPLTREASLIAPSENRLVANKQKCWLRPLDDRARIEIALGSAEPVRYWREVMDALGRLSSPRDEEIRSLLRSKTWMPTTCPAPVKPEDVINLRESLSDEAHRLVAEHRKVHGHCFAIPADLDAAVRDHDAWPRLREVAFSSGAEGLERLGLLLEDLPDYCIGKWTEQPRPDVVGLLARYDQVPGWRLLELAAESFGAEGAEIAWDQLGPALLKELAPRRLAEALDWLSRDDDQWELRKSAHDDHLRQLKAHGQSAVREHLPRRLASGNRRWRKATELCVGAHGVVQSSLLDGEQAAILGNSVCRAERRVGGDQPDAPAVDFQQERSAAPNLLRDYFGAWDSSPVPPPMIGVVLALLGPDVRELAGEYLRPHSFEWLAKQLPWQAPEAIPQRQALALSGTRTALQAIERVKVGIQVQTANDVEVRNLLGGTMLVSLDAKAPTLLAGQLRYRWRNGYEVIIPLRRIDLDRLSTERLHTLLRATAEGLHGELYNQPPADFGSLWKELNRSDQLEIGIARRMILDHIPFYLRQLSVQSEPIKERLANYESKRRVKAEAEAGKDGQSAEPARELRQALDELASCIDGRPDERRAVLQAVKSKVEQYQYDPSSIPLELFQNADDAAIELGQFSDGSEVPESARRFVVEERDDGLGFLHWGRPINARGPVGFDGEGRGYDRDLEKMLILSATDKPGDEGVTGKFGLGFKSVLLACDEPRILSGRLAVRVVAGILPQPWEDDVYKARQRLVDLGSDSRQPGTLVDLPGVEGELRSRVLGRFRQLAGILCVFGRAIRTITHVGVLKSSWSWEPVGPEACPGVEVGELRLQGEWGDRTKALCVRTGDGNLLMALGPQGFRPLPDSVPALWVTAPTKEPLSIGFAVNGSFDLDAGRGRLAGDTDKNLARARRIGQQAGDALGALLERSREDWRSVQETLGLAADFDVLDFWESVWLGLTRGWLPRPRQNGEELARAVALGALTRLCNRQCAVPNGLKGSLCRFSGAGEIRYELSGVLLREDVGEQLGAWERFTNRYPAGECVSGEIGNILREAESCRPRSIGLSALAGLLERSRVEPADAETLGRMWLLTEEEKDWESKDLQERLRGLRFRSGADEWTEACKLLAVRGPLSDDEPRRHKLAPPGCRLHTDYYVERNEELPAVAFFLACRQHMEATAETLEQWVLAAKSVEERTAAIGYLADGELGERVAERVRERDWLASVSNDSGIMNRLTEEQQRKLLRRLVPSERLQRVFADPDPDPDLPKPSAPCGETDGYRSKEEEMIANILKEEAMEFEYEKPLEDDEGVLCPDFSFTTASGERLVWEHLGMWYHEESEVAEKYREEWRKKIERYKNLKYREGSTLFTTKNCDREECLSVARQSFGRAQDQQHRGFIDRGYRDGWWREIAESIPPAPDKIQPWLTRLERWSGAERFDQEFLHWERTLVDLYTITRWLTQYTELFRKLPSIVREEGIISLKDVLRPSHSPVIRPLGLNAAPLDRSLGIGVNWLIRELARNGVYGPDDARLMAPYCWMPTERVRRLLTRLGMSNLSPNANPEDSREIHEFIVKHLREERARFGGDFDLPLQLITRASYRDDLNRCFQQGGLDAPDFDEGEDDGDDFTGGDPA